MKKTALIILDGWGMGKSDKTDGVFLAKTPFVDSLKESTPNSTLITFGEQVGLPKGQMGNSEVGHMNIGAGRIVYQDLVKINKSIADKSFYKNKILLKGIQKALDTGVKIHLLGLVSKGGVHSNQEHIYASAKLCNEMGIAKNQLFLHAFTDGRDCDPKSGKEFLKETIENCKDTPLKVASIIGRYFAMDRDKRWERIKLAYDLLLHGKGNTSKDPVLAIQESYDNGITDEFIKPTVFVDENDVPLAKIEEDDVVICFNFRTDRCREITQVLTQENMINEGMKTINLHYITMTNYSKSFKNIHVMYEKDELVNTLGEVVSDNKGSQLRIAETEKYPHVSFFFNGGREQPFNLENRIMVNSPKVATYDLQPEMSAHEVTEKVIQEIKTTAPDFICLNFANGDMVGHTGVPKAILKACETVDSCLEEIVIEGSKKGYAFIVIADHGNADKMMNPDGSPHTAHTLNLVPCYLINSDYDEIKSGILADVAPTILKLMEIQQPKEMTGTSLI